MQRLSCFVVNEYLLDEIFEINPPPSTVIAPGANDI
jgi:hypothetical protein